MGYVRLLLCGLFLAGGVGESEAQTAVIALSEGKYPVANVTRAKGASAITDQMVRDCIVRNGTECAPHAAWAAGDPQANNLVIVRCDTAAGGYSASGVRLPRSSTKKEMFQAGLSAVRKSASENGRVLVERSCTSAITYYRGQFFAENRKITPTYDVSKAMREAASSLKGTNWCGRNPEARATDAQDTVCVKFNRFDQKGRAPSRMVTFKNGNRVRGLSYKLSYSVSPDLQIINVGLTGLVLTYDVARGRMSGFAPDDGVTMDFSQQD